jgi:hypothetical protein
MLICLAQETQDKAEALELAVRARWPSAAQILICHVIDLRKVPGIFRGMAENLLVAEYKKELAKLPAYQTSTPDDYILMLPDWQGEVADALGIEDPARAIGAVIIGPSGEVIGALSDPSPESVVELALQALGVEPSTGA